MLVHSLGGEGYLNFEGNEFGHPEVSHISAPSKSGLGLTCFLVAGFPSRRQWELF